MNSKQELSHCCPLWNDRRIESWTGKIPLLRQIMKQNLSFSIFHSRTIFTRDCGNYVCKSFNVATFLVLQLNDIEVRHYYFTCRCVWISCSFFSQNILPVPWKFVFSSFFLLFFTDLLLYGCFSPFFHATRSDVIHLLTTMHTRVLLYLWQNVCIGFGQLIMLSTSV